MIIKEDWIDPQDIIGWYTDKQGRRRPIVQTRGRLRRPILGIFKREQPKQELEKETPRPSQKERVRELFTPEERERIKVYYNQLKDEKKEQVYIIKPDGKVLYANDGSDRKVSIFVAPVVYQGSTIIHNHPHNKFFTASKIFCNNTFSPQDIIAHSLNKAGKSVLIWNGLIKVLTTTRSIIFNFQKREIQDLLVKYYNLNLVESISRAKNDINLAFKIYNKAAEGFESDLKKMGINIETFTIEDFD